MNFETKKPNPNNNEWKTVPTQLKPYSPEWFLSNYLENWDDNDLRIAIENDVRPDLSTYADMILDQTTDFFLNFLKSHRTDLKHAQTKEGRAWIRRIVKSATGFR